MLLTSFVGTSLGRNAFYVWTTFCEMNQASGWCHGVTWFGHMGYHVFKVDQSRGTYLFSALAQRLVFVVRVVGDATSCTQLHSSQKLHTAGKGGFL